MCNNCNSFGFCRTLYYELVDDVMIGKQLFEAQKNGEAYALPCYCYILWAPWPFLNIALLAYLLKPQSSKACLLLFHSDK